MKQQRLQYERTNKPAKALRLLGWLFIIGAGIIFYLALKSGGPFARSNLQMVEGAAGIGFSLILIAHFVAWWHNG